MLFPIPVCVYCQLKIINCNTSCSWRPLVLICLCHNVFILRCQNTLLFSSLKTCSQEAQLLFATPAQVAPMSLHKWLFWAWFRHCKPRSVIHAGTTKGILLCKGLVHVFVFDDLIASLERHIRITCSPVSSRRGEART